MSSAYHVSGSALGYESCPACKGAREATGLGGATACERCDGRGHLDREKVLIFYDFQEALAKFSSSARTSKPRCTGRPDLRHHLRYRLR